MENEKNIFILEAMNFAIRFYCRFDRFVLFLFLRFFIIIVFLSIRQKLRGNQCSGQFLLGLQIDSLPLL